MKTIEWLSADRERLLVVNDPGELAKLLRRRYPQFDVTVSGSYLSGVAALGGSHTRGLLVGVDPTARKLGQAVAGLRKAAGTTARLVLCCLPSGEPAARAALSAGADDYIIYPPQGNELDQALAGKIGMDARVLFAKMAHANDCGTKGQGILFPVII